MDTPLPSSCSSTHHAGPPLLLWALAWGLCQPAFAQTPAASPTPAAEAIVVITGNPLGSPRIAAPVSVLSGDALVQRRAATLGETLDGLPGVSSTRFGPNANRPVIRGLDGDRVRILTNAGASLDASALSYDHALPLDPLILTRIEVLRGPGALFYGGSAVGGVVNAIDNRIPSAPLLQFGGSTELRLGGAARERGGAAVLESGNGTLAWHADAFARDTSDLRVPQHTPVADGEALPPTHTVRNSASRTRGGALGGTLFLGAGRIGLSLDTYDSRYGVVAEPDITISMRRHRLGLAGELRDLGGPLKALRFNANHSDYQHQEIEGDGAVGTVFTSQGSELRIEAEHGALGPLRGVIGLQLEDFDFSALGDEAFVPDTRTRKSALFALEEMSLAGGTLSLGARLERARVDSGGDADPAAPKFGTAQHRSFDLRSLSLAYIQPLNAAWTLSGSLGSSERAPSYFELYANGVHAATAAFERGDAALQHERGNQAELALQLKTEKSQLRVGVFGTRFSRFISLQASGDEVDDSGTVVAPGTPESVPLYLFQAVRARLQGWEIEGRSRLLERPWALDATLRFDTTRASNSDTGEPLPRVAPWRLALGLEAEKGPWSLRAEVDHAARQSRVPINDQPTTGWTQLHLALAWRFALGSADGLWSLKLGNVGDRLAYSATAIQTLRGLSPLPGRALSTALRLNW
ncbi:Membrane receptor protein [Rubrivivax sp. A210]|uniref:TonB-dependent receptor n=1 Tax=Rubrivivax sp. A210 TaxID=2772301 RepID=UPI00191B2A60|nr:TonB-dependent receptor [Rubrivivax sp. A210]CAD5372419.1 Membrane receptor protein [Rubrivivax sp. A210]